MYSNDCRAVMDHLDVIKAVAEGRDVYFAAFDCYGKFIEWRATNKVLLSPLASGFYCVKPRYQCIKPGKLKPIPYPHQAAEMTRRKP